MTERQAPKWGAALRLAGFVATVASLVGALLVVTAAPAFAASLSVSPPSGPRGTTITLTPTNIDPACGTITYIWSNPVQSLGSGSVSAAFSTYVPANAALGPVVIRGSTPTCGAVSTTFTVTSPTTTTQHTTTTPTTAPKHTTTTAGSIPTVPGQPTTTQAGATTTSSTTSSSTTTTVDKHHKKKTVSKKKHSVTVVTTPASYLHLNQLAIAPGGSVTAIGRGCDGDSPVVLTIGSTRVGHATANTEGTFRAPVAASTLAVGRYDVKAHCGAILVAPLDVVLANKVDPGTATTMVIIVFFVLIGLFVFRRQLFPRSPGHGPPIEQDVSP
jgi:hypothetical protein